MIGHFFSLGELASYTPFENFLMFSLEGGLLYPFALLSFFGRQKEFKFAFIWFIIASIIPIFFLGHIELRYLCWNMIPLAILIFLGAKVVYTLLNQKDISSFSRKTLFVTLFILVLVGNHFLVAAGPDKIDAPAYHRLFIKLDKVYEDKTLLVSTSWDYFFIKFAYPNEDVIDVGGTMGRGREEVMRLLEQNETILYISCALKRNFYIYNYERNYYNVSWIVHNSRFVLTKVAEDGRYTAHLLREARYE
jgi:hypothetical protein